jgi:hypothetical protein
LRNVSAETPNLCAMEVIAAHCEGCWECQRDVAPHCLSEVAPPVV